MVSGEIILFPKDSLSTIGQGSQPSPSEISSLVDNEHDRTTVLTLNFADAGFDGFPTFVNKIVFTQGTDNEIDDWATAIAGATLFGPDLGEISGNELFGTVSPDSIVFSDTLMFAVPDGGQEKYQLKIWLKTDSASYDCKQLAFALNNENIVVDTSGSAFANATFESSPVRISFEKDRDAKVLLSDSLLADTIFSAVNTYADRQTVFRFKITDTDTDKYQTVIDEIVFSPATANSIHDWTKAIEGAALYGTDLGNESGSEIIGSIAENTITFSQEAMSVIAQKDTHFFELRIWFKTDLDKITDGDTLAFALSSHNIKTSECHSSEIDTAYIESQAITVSIKATNLVFKVNQPPLYVEQNVDFSVTVLAVDGNNNIDAYANDAITLEVHDGTGQLISSQSLTQTLSQGSFSWHDIAYDEIEKFVI